MMGRLKYAVIVHFPWQTVAFGPFTDYRAAWTKHRELEDFHNDEQRDPRSILNYSTDAPNLKIEVADLFPERRRFFRRRNS